MDFEEFTTGPWSRKWTVPTNANPDPNQVHMICPREKLERGIGLNFKEDGLFRGVCGLGSNQLIACYGRYTTDWYSPQDFALMCKKCQYAIATKDGYDPYKLSMFDANYIIGLYSDYIASGEDNIGSYVYFISDGESIKIGKAKVPRLRLDELQTGNPKKLSVLYQIPTKSERFAHRIESGLHNLYSSYRLCGEWFDILDKLDKKSFNYFKPEWFDDESKGE